MMERNERVALKLGYNVHYGEFMGAPCCGMYETSYWTKGKDYFCRVPNYCEDIKAAWEIVNSLGSDYWIDLDQQHSPDWVCSISKGGPVRLNPRAEARAGTAPMAICLAFLKLKIPK